MSVIIYHAEFISGGSLIFPGGFLGVDIFFVISGFLISRIIINEVSNKQFSFKDFYNRRARRILPAALVVTLVVLVVGFLVLLPKALVELSQSAIASTFFSSNFFFWLSDSYVAEPSKVKPLLHTWSLSVEEQFYFVFPFILLAIFKLGKKNLLPAIVVLFVLSLLYAQLSWERDSDGVFFLLPSRAWEMLAGSFLAAVYSYRGEQLARRPGMSDALSLMGIVLILLSFIFYDDKMQHPSVFTMVPVLATAFVIYFTRPGSISYALLGNTPMRAVGLISYSWYLWHWPVFVYMRLTQSRYVGI